MTNPDAASSYRTFSYSGYTETLVDENLHKTDTVHDAYGRTVSVNEYKGNGQTGNPYVLDATTSYQYDVLDRMTRINDAASPSNQTDIQYTAPLGFRSQLTDPDTGSQFFTYYDDGSLKTRTDARGEVVTTTYDGLGRIKTKSYSGPVAAPTITYTYDTCQLNCPDTLTKGQLTLVSYSDNSQRYRYSYDARGRLINKLSEIDGLGYGVQHAYDPMGRETTTWYPGGETVSRTFDSQGLTETVGSGLSTYLSSTTYNAAGQPTQLAFGNGKTQDFAYNLELRLSTLTLNTITPITYTYGYDSKGNLSSIQDSSISPPNQTTMFSYDERDRLISTGGTSAPTRSTFEYDKIGNMTRKEEGPIEGVARETAANCALPGDEDNDGKINDGCTTTYSSLCYSPQQTGCSGVVSGRPHATKTVTGNSPNFGVSSSFTGTYTYDAMGNLLEMSGSNGTNNGSLGLLMRLHKTGEPGEGYDAEGRLWKVEYNKLDSGTDLAFYDLNGDCRVTGSDQSFLQNPSNQKSYPDPGYNSLYDLNSDGSVNSLDQGLLTPLLNKWCPQFTYDQDGQLVKVSGPKNVVYIDGVYEKNLDTGVETKYYFTDGRRIAMRAGSALSYLANDHLGSTAFIMDSTGALVTHLRYYANGMTWSQSSSNPATDLLFTGYRRMGSKSGTYYANARFYGADTGRFLQPDNFMPDKPMPPDLNRYSYVKNSPETFTDPSGHFLEYVVIDFSNFQMSTEGAIALMAGLPHPLLPPGITEVPVSGFGACAPYVYCCEVQAGPHAGTYVCGFYGSGGGGLLSLLDNFFDDAIGWLGDQVDWLLDHLSGVDWEEAAKALLQLKDALNQVKTCVGAAAVVMEGVNVIRLGALAYASPDPATKLLGPGLIGGGLVVTWAGYEWGATSNCWPSVT